MSFQLLVEPGLLALAEKGLASERIGHVPTFFAIEAEDQPGSRVRSSAVPSAMPSICSVSSLSGTH